MRYITSKLLVLAAIFTVSLLSISVSAQRSAFSQSALEKKVRHEILMLPYYDVFDYVKYSVSPNGVVTLSGSVNESSTKKDAARRVEKIDGVSQVVNQIEVLPLSNYDDQLRRRVYQAIGRMGGLGGYLQGVNPDIHIIVNRGRITLEGKVRTRTDANMAYMAARGVSGSFAVTNALVAEKDQVR